MTSPEVNVGSIVAKVSLDTSGLKRSEADSSASLKRTSTNLGNTAASAEKVQKNVEKATTAIKRSGDVQIDTIRRTTTAQQQAERDTVRRGSRAGAAGGAVAGALFGQFASQGLQAIGDGNGGRRDGISAVGQGAFTGGALGALIGPEGAAAGAAIGGGIGAALHYNELFHPDKVRQQAEQARADAAQAAADARTSAHIRRQAQFADDLGRAQLRAEDAQNKLRAARADVYDPKSRASAQAREAGIIAPVIGGAFDEQPSGTKGDVGKAADRLEAANVRLANAKQRVVELSAGTTQAARSTILSAEAAVARAQAAVANPKGDQAADRLRLQAAEAHLSELRGKGSVNTNALVTAERNLTEARRKADAAAKAAKDAGATTGLDSKTLLDRLKVNTADVQQLDHDTRDLVKRGLSAPLIEELLSTEKSAPGTVHRVVTSITAAQIKAMNGQEKALQKAAADLIQAPIDRALKDAERNSYDAAYRAAVATKRAFAAALGGEPRSPNAPAFTPADPSHSGRGIPVDPFTAPLTGARAGSSGGVTITGPVTIVAPNPASLVAAIQKETRVRALGGGGVMVTP